MMGRTSKKAVTFRRPFVLSDFDEVLPAGTYEVETDEELLEGLSFTAYRRITSTIKLHAMPGRPGVARSLTIDPNELDAAVKRDQVLEDVGIARAAIPKTRAGATSPRQEAPDHLTIARAEDDGMIVVPRQTSDPRSATAS